MSRWFRFYNDVVNDPKVQRLPGDKFKAWVNLLCVASRNQGVLPSTEDLAFMLRTSEEEVSALLEYFSANGLIDAVEAGFEPHNWRERQFESDSSAERVRRHRAKRANQEQVTNNQVTDNASACNVTDTVTVTPPEQNRAEQIQSRADTRDADQKRLGDFQQAIVRAYAEAGSTTLPDTAYCELLLSRGYDPEICLAVIKTRLPRRPNVTLAYFEAPIAEAHAKRAPPRLQLIEPPKHDWEAAAKLWKAIRRWPKGHGNDPDSPACLCPREILQKHGIAGAA